MKAGNSAEEGRHSVVASIMKHLPENGKGA